METIGTTPAGRRFPIRFERGYGVLSSWLLLPPSRSFVELRGEDVVVEMGWGFRARFPRSAVRAAAPYRRRVVSRGVHGWWGRWLVNGSGDGVVALALAPPQRARVVGFPVGLRELLVSVEDPAAFLAALRR